MVKFYTLMYWSLKGSTKEGTNKSAIAIDSNTGAPASKLLFVRAIPLHPRLGGLECSGAVAGALVVITRSRFETGYY